MTWPLVFVMQSTPNPVLTLHTYVYIGAHCSEQHAWPPLEIFIILPVEWGRSIISPVHAHPAPVHKVNMLYCIAFAIIAEPSLDGQCVSCSKTNSLLLPVSV